jgi:hypothetical protein
MTHIIDRTSPMGTSFIGKCRLCGKEGLRIADVNDECHSHPELSDDDRVLLAIDEEPTK